MAYDVVVAGSVQRTLWRTLGELVGEEHVRSDAGSTVVTVPDHAALVGVLTRLNDLGIHIDEVRGVPSP